MKKGNNKYPNPDIHYIYQPLHWWGEENCKPITAALFYTMLLTGVHRLFTKDDVHEYLLRLPIALKEHDVASSFFLHDQLFTFQFGGLHYVFTTDHLRRLIGFQACDAIENFLNREDWIKTRKERYSAALLITSLIFKTEIIISNMDKEVATISNKKSEVNIKNKRFSVSEVGMTFQLSKVNKPILADVKAEDFWPAEIVAKQLLKEFGDQSFIMIQKGYVNKVEELMERRQPFTMPAFQLDQLSSENQAAIDAHFNHILICMLGDIDKIYEEDFQYWKERKEKVLYLAWLWANGFAWKKPIYGTWDLEIHEKVPFNMDDYETDGYISLVAIIRDWELEKIKPLLEIEEVKRIAATLF